jgi:hypothetical protein
MLCKLGLHKWQYSYSNFEERMKTKVFCLEYEESPTTRTCKCCNISQTKEYHCLGNNPLKHIIYWQKV